MTSSQATATEPKLSRRKLIAKSEKAKSSSHYQLDINFNPCSNRLKLLLAPVEAATDEHNRSKISPFQKATSFDENEEKMVHFGTVSTLISNLTNSLISDKTTKVEPTRLKKNETKEPDTDPKQHFSNFLGMKSNKKSENAQKSNAGKANSKFMVKVSSESPFSINTNKSENREDPGTSKQKKTKKPKDLPHYCEFDIVKQLKKNKLHGENNQIGDVPKKAQKIGAKKESKLEEKLSKKIRRSNGEKASKCSTNHKTDMKKTCKQRIISPEILKNGTDRQIFFILPAKTDPIGMKTSKDCKNSLAIKETKSSIDCSRNNVNLKKRRKKKIPHPSLKSDYSNSDKNTEISLVKTQMEMHPKLNNESTKNTNKISKRHKCILSSTKSEIITGITKKDSKNASTNVKEHSYRIKNKEKKSDVIGDFTMDTVKGNTDKKKLKRASEGGASSERHKPNSEHHSVTNKSRSQSKSKYLKKIGAGTKLISNAKEQRSILRVAKEQPSEEFSKTASLQNSQELMKKSCGQKIPKNSGQKTKHLIKHDDISSQSQVFEDVDNTSSITVNLRLKNNLMVNNPTKPEKHDQLNTGESSSKSINTLARNDHFQIDSVENTSLEQISQNSLSKKLSIHTFAVDNLYNNNRTSSHRKKTNRNALKVNLSATETHKHSESLKNSEESLPQVKTEEKSSEVDNARKEVSFSQLNLAPVVAFYQTATTFYNSAKILSQKHVCIENFEKPFPNALKDVKLKKSKNKHRCKLADKTSVLSEAITKKEKQLHGHNSTFTINNLKTLAAANNKIHLLKLLPKTFAEGGVRKKTYATDVKSRILQKTLLPIVEIKSTQSFNSNIAFIIKDKERKRRQLERFSISKKNDRQLSIVSNKPENLGSKMSIKDFTAEPKKTLLKINYKFPSTSNNDSDGSSTATDPENVLKGKTLQQMNASRDVSKIPRKKMIPDSEFLKKDVNSYNNAIKNKLVKQLQNTVIPHFPQLMPANIIQPKINFDFKTPEIAPKKIFGTPYSTIPSTLLRPNNDASTKVIYGSLENISEETYSECSTDADLQKVMNNLTPTSCSNKPRIVETQTGDVSILDEAHYYTRDTERRFDRFSKKTFLDSRSKSPTISEPSTTNSLSSIQQAMFANDKTATESINNQKNISQEIMNLETRIQRHIVKELQEAKLLKTKGSVQDTINVMKNPQIQNDLKQLEDLVTISVLNEMKRKFSVTSCNFPTESKLMRSGSSTRGDHFEKNSYDHKVIYEDENRERLQDLINNEFTVNDDPETNLTHFVPMKSIQVMSASVEIDRSKSPNNFDRKESIVKENFCGVSKGDKFYQHYSAIEHKPKYMPLKNIISTLDKSTSTELINMENRLDFILGNTPAENLEHVQKHINVTNQSVVGKSKAADCRHINSTLATDVFFATPPLMQVSFNQFTRPASGSKIEQENCKIPLPIRARSDLQREKMQSTKSFVCDGPSTSKKETNVILPYSSKPSSPRTSSCFYTKEYKDTTRCNTFLKRKRYAESLRHPKKCCAKKLGPIQSSESTQQQNTEKFSFTSVQDVVINFTSDENNPFEDNSQQPFKKAKANHTGVSCNETKPCSFATFSSPENEFTQVCQPYYNSSLNLPLNMEKPFGCVPNQSSKNCIGIRPITSEHEYKSYQQDSNSSSVSIILRPNNKNNKYAATHESLVDLNKCNKTYGNISMTAERPLEMDEYNSDHSFVDFLNKVQHSIKNINKINDFGNNSTDYDNTLKTQCENYDSERSLQNLSASTSNMGFKISLSGLRSLKSRIPIRRLTPYKIPTSISNNSNAVPSLSLRYSDKEKKSCTKHMESNSVFPKFDNDKKVLNAVLNDDTSSEIKYPFRTYQTFTVLTEQPDLTDVFSNIYRCAESRMSLISKDSLSSLSSPNDLKTTESDCTHHNYFDSLNKINIDPFDSDSAEILNTTEELKKLLGKKNTDQSGIRNVLNKSLYKIENQHPLPSKVARSVKSNNEVDVKASSDLDVKLLYHVCNTASEFIEKLDKQLKNKQEDSLNDNMNTPKNVAPGKLSLLEFCQNMKNSSGHNFFENTPQSDVTDDSRPNFDLINNFFANMAQSTQKYTENQTAAEYSEFDVSNKDSQEIFDANENFPDNIVEACSLTAENDHSSNFLNNPIDTAMLPIQNTKPPFGPSIKLFVYNNTIKLDKDDTTKFKSCSGESSGSSKRDAIPNTLETSPRSGGSNERYKSRGSQSASSGANHKSLGRNNSDEDDFTNKNYTLISEEQGYEKFKTKRVGSLRNIFKKGGSLLIMFNSSKKKPSLYQTPIRPNFCFSCDQREKNDKNNAQICSAETSSSNQHGNQKYSKNNFKTPQYESKNYLKDVNDEQENSLKPKTNFTTHFFLHNKRKVRKKVDKYTNCCQEDVPNTPLNGKKTTGCIYEESEPVDLKIINEMEINQYFDDDSDDCQSVSPCDDCHQPSSSKINKKVTFQKSTQSTFNSSLSRLKNVFRVLSKSALSGKSSETNSSRSCSTSTTSFKKKFFRSSPKSMRDEITKPSIPKPIESGINNLFRPGSEDYSFYQKKVNECKEYAEKIRITSKLREEGHLRQLQDFREIPLSVLLGKTAQTKPKFLGRNVQINPKFLSRNVQIKPKFLSRNVQTKPQNMTTNSSDTNETLPLISGPEIAQVPLTVSKSLVDYDSGSDDEKTLTPSFRKHSTAFSDHVDLIKQTSTSATQWNVADAVEFKKLVDVRKPSPKGKCAANICKQCKSQKCYKKKFGSDDLHKIESDDLHKIESDDLHKIISDDLHKIESDHFSDDGIGQSTILGETSKHSLHALVKSQESLVDVRKRVSTSQESLQRDRSNDEQSDQRFMEEEEIYRHNHQNNSSESVNFFQQTSLASSEKAKSFDLPKEKIRIDSFHSLQKFKNNDSKILDTVIEQDDYTQEDSGKLESSQQSLQKLEDIRKNMSDEEVFEKLLASYEKENEIVERLSNDEEFFHRQIEFAQGSVSLGSSDNTRRGNPDAPDEENQTVVLEQSSEFINTVSIGSLGSQGADLHRSSSIITLDGSKLKLTKRISVESSKLRLDDTQNKKLIIFAKDDVKEIVLPRSIKNSASIDHIDSAAISQARIDAIRDDEIAHDLEEINTNDDENQKVKFHEDLDPFEEEKRMFHRRSSIMSDEDVLLASSKKPRKAQSVESTESNCGTVKPQEIGKCFRRGFRPDNINLTGTPVEGISSEEKQKRLTPQLIKQFGSVIEFSERETALDFLLALGFSIDEASNALKDEDVKNRLYAAVTEARIWINQISMTQGTLLYLLAYKATPRTMRYFLQLVEAIINKRINNAVKLDGFLKLLERVEDGDLTMIAILGSDKFEDEENEEKLVKKQLRQLFSNVYRIAEAEAQKSYKRLTREGVILLRILSAKYRAGLNPHLELIARYIGLGLITSEVQLEAAMIYLSRLDTADVNLMEFEYYCAIRCDERPWREDTPKKIKGNLKETGKDKEKDKKKDKEKDIEKDKDKDKGKGKGKDEGKDKGKDKRKIRM